MYITSQTSPIGTLVLTSDGTNLTGLYLKHQKYFLDGISEDLERKDDLKIFKQTKSWLKHYFAGSAPSPHDLKLKPKGTVFRRTVWKELLNIPYGATITYKELSKKVAKKLGRKTMSAQAIGQAVGHNPISIIIPCHRVIGTSGNLVGYAGGISKKAYLLTLEQKKKRG